ncbi:MAG: gluconate 2-dehydrogenase subunit 3 family protein [Acidobacteria bacterium]|nr:gluconate 2-dehydrogenase subunit 3 family protein [Acidobacteriota bacterium]
MINRRQIFQAAAVAVPAAALGQQVEWKPLTLDAHQNQTVVVLSDLIIPATDTPGAKDANVNRYIDLFLTDGSEADRNRFLEGLGQLDGYSVRKFGKTFIDATKDQQITILKEFSAGTAGKPSQNFFTQAKMLTSRIYYNTAIGFRELNKGGRVPRTFACKV